MSIVQRSDGLGSIKSALEALSDTELRGLIDAAYTVPATAPGFFVWIQASCEWELNRRAGTDYELRPLAEVIPYEEHAISASAAIALRELFSQSANVHAFFDAFVGLLTADSQ